MDFASLIELARTSALRLFRGNFRVMQASDEERGLLSAAGVEDPTAQDYAAWRRGALTIGAAAMILWSLVSLLSFTTFEERLFEQQLAEALEFQKQQAAVMGGTVSGERREELKKEVRSGLDATVEAIGEGNLEITDGVLMLIRLTSVAGAVLVFLAARSWDDLPASRRWVRLAFYVVFLTPFGLALFPFTSIMDFDQLDERSGRQLQLFLGGQIAGALFLVLGPRSLALYPGAIRSSITLKSLLPQSAIPGWMVVILAPLYPVFLVLVVSAVNQTSGSLALVLGLLCLMAAPMLYVVHAREVVAPMTPDEFDQRFTGIRGKVMVLNLVGSAMVLVFLADLDIFGFGDFLQFVTGFVGNFVLVTVVMSDLMLALMAAGHRQTSSFHGSELAPVLEKSLVGLDAAGLTAIRAPKPGSPGNPAQPGGGEAEAPAAD